MDNHPIRRRRELACCDLNGKFFVLINAVQYTGHRFPFILIFFYVCLSSLTMIISSLM